MEAQQLNPQDISKVMPDVPVYPRASYNPQISKFMIFPKMFMPKEMQKGMLFVAFSITDPADQVVSWYKTNMNLKGWQLVQERSQASNPSTTQKMVMFRKDAKNCIIMVQETPQLKMLLIMYFAQPQRLPQKKGP